MRETCVWYTWYNTPQRGTWDKNRMNKNINNNYRRVVLPGKEPPQDIPSYYIYKKMLNKERVVCWNTPGLCFYDLIYYEYDPC